MTPPYHFAYQRTSWYDELDCVRPGSPSDLICREIQRHMPKSSYTVGREPLPGRINIYTSTRPAFNNDVRGTERLSVLLGHGCADKNIWGRHAPQFDYTITPGPMVTDLVRRSGVPHDRILELGMAKLDPIFNGSIQGLPKDGRPRILFAPTHGGGGDMEHMGDTQPPRWLPAHRRTSWWRRDEVLGALDTEALDVLECHHPRYTAGHKATLHQYVGADVAIADGGSTLYECIVQGIPLVIPRWITGKANSMANTTEGMLYRTGVGRHAGSPSGLAHMVHTAAQHGPTKSEAQLSHRILTPDMRGQSGRAQAEWLMSLV